MGHFDTDLTKADVVDDGDYLVNIKAVTPKTSNPNEVTGETSEYLVWQLSILNEGEFRGRNLFHITSFKSPFAIKHIMDAAKAAYDKTGFNPDVCVEKQINVRVVTKDSPEYGPQNNVVKSWAV